MKVLLFLAFIGVCSAHFCLISPPQRGSMQGLNTAGTPDCLLLQAPCGNRKSSNPSVGLVSGRNISITFQKNMDHWAQATPGYFSIDIATSETAQFELLARIPDNGEPSLHLYSVNVTIPTPLSGTSAVLRSLYVTKNAMAPPVFYQCADIFVS